MITYPTRIDTIDFGEWGSFRFIQWLHNGALSFAGDTVEKLSRFIPRGSFAIDIGAYTGDTALPMAIATGPAGLVLAFEPGPAAFPILTDNIALNVPPLHIKAINAAVTASGDTATFHYVDPGYINGGFSTEISAGPSGCGNTYPIFVKCVRLDETLKRDFEPWLHRWSYLKIDAEGYDKEILKANSGFIRKYSPIIEVEVYPFLTYAERRELMSVIHDMRYRYDIPDEQFFLPPPSVVNVTCLPS